MKRIPPAKPMASLALTARAAACAAIRTGPFRHDSAACAPGRKSGRAGLLRKALMIGLMATASILGPALAAKAGNAPSGGGAFAGLPAMSRVDQIAETVSVNGQPPPPGALIVSQIHNAPGWQASHTYTYAAGPYTRVVSGPGWNPASGSYNPGERLDAYQLISTGTCTSASNGGPGGTGASIKDGTCTWKYLSTVDYISITGWAFDNQPWKSGTYYYGSYVTAGTPLRAYLLADSNCTSTVAPAGNTGTNDRYGGVTFATSDGCHWDYVADILYSSEKSYIPTQTYINNTTSPATYHMQSDYEAQLWNDREYVAGQNGENVPIMLRDHVNDPRGGGEGNPFIGCATLMTHETNHCHTILINPAPGEGFADNLTPGQPLGGYDPTKGVALKNTTTVKWPYEPTALFLYDAFVTAAGLQFKSIHGAAVFGYNYLTIRDSILDGGSDESSTYHEALFLDAGPCVLANSLVISHSEVGVVLKYPGVVLHSTVVNINHVANSVGIETGNTWSFTPTTISNTAIFGFTHASAFLLPGTVNSPQSSNNMTDAPVGDSGTTTWVGERSATVNAIPGTVYGVVASAAFVNPGSDWRLSAGSPLLGAGSAFGSFTTGCPTNALNCPARTTYNFDTPNIIGIARPQAGRYNIGAW
jgi:hypothetical protein